MEAEGVGSAAAWCPLCRSPGGRRLFSARDRIHHRPGTFSIFACPRCRALFIQPYLKNLQLADYYPEDYSRFRHSSSPEKKRFGGVRRFVLENYYGYPRRNGGRPGAVAKFAARLLSGFAAKGAIPYRGEGRFLDVGCGGGSHLDRLRQWGWETYGVEPSAAGAAQARRLGLSVFQGVLEDARFQSGFFDAIRLNHVLEHLVDPVATFRELHRILKPDGRVYVTAPNTRSLTFWLLREDWYGLDAPRHVISYRPETLRALCDASGFEIVKIKFRAGPFCLVRSVRLYFDGRGRAWPAWIRNIPWERSKAIRRSLRPFFRIVDAAGFGDFFHAVLRKKTE